MRRMRSKKWQAFSTRVPPVLRLKRFQLSTLTRKGKRCSRIDRTLGSPSFRESDSSIRRRMGGMYRYSMPVMKTGAFSDPERTTRSVRSRSTSSQSSTVVHNGFSQRMCLPDIIAFRSVWMCWKFGVQMMSTSTKSQFISSSSDRKTATRGARSPSSSRASRKAASLESAIAVTTICSPINATLRMCSLPMAPVPMIPARRAGPRSGLPRSAARTRRGGSKLCREWRTLPLSTMRMSPFFQAKATSLSAIKRATALSACLFTGLKSPSRTASSPTFLESFQPVKAAMTELKKTRRPVRSSMRRAGRAAVVTFRSPPDSHSHVEPCLVITSSASSRVLTA
mmetsp:Transcript_46847/g.109389  ORF Transcript_46847/g.109389 Transcript_46847/m.109389 type:complete len:339 (+) Transcript_46847:771-1787(+)